MNTLANSQLERGSYADDTATRQAICLVLWTGEYGGAETWTLSLAHALAKKGNQVGLLIVGHAEPLFAPPRTSGLRVVSLGLRRGRDVLFRVRALARAVSSISPEVAILPSAGFLSAALKAGGYRGQVIAIEHGSLRNLRSVPWPRRLPRIVSELGGVWAVDAQVTPSDFMKAEVQRYPHAGILRRIYPGLDLTRYCSEADATAHSASGNVRVRLGFAGRLIRGKGVDTLLRGIAGAKSANQVRLQVAGDGPEFESLSALARELGVQASVEFRGWVSDMPAFWRAQDLAVVPSHQLEESFGMVAAEAMSCGTPVIASRNGGLEEVVEDGSTGALFPVGDWRSLSRVLDQYVADPPRIVTQAKAAVARCQAKFDIDRCAAEFESLIRELRMSVAKSSQESADPRSGGEQALGSRTS